MKIDIFRSTDTYLSFNKTIFNFIRLRIKSTIYIQTLKLYLADIKKILNPHINLT